MTKTCTEQLQNKLVGTLWRTNGAMVTLIMLMIHQALIEMNHLYPSTTIKLNPISAVPSHDISDMDYG